MELNINQAAAYLNCSVDTIRRRIRSGQLQARLDDRGRYMITFQGGEPASAAAPAPTQVMNEMPAGHGNVEIAPGDWYDAWPERRAGDAPPPAIQDSPSAPPTEHDQSVQPLGPSLVPPQPERRDFAPIPPQRRATDPGLNEQIARLREEREDLIQELQMWRDEAMAAKVALEELRRLIPQTLSPKKQGGFFRRG